MFKKVTLFCLATLAVARPDKPAPPPPTGYGYSAPAQPISYAPPAPTYSAPEPTYGAPEPTYGAPEPTYGAPEPSYSAPAPTYEEPQKGMPFDFDFAVNDQYQGLDFAHDSESDGNVVNGQYRVLLPDGRTQIVTYTADNSNGYQAEVTYEGEARYPEPQPNSPASAYSAPAPAYSAPAPAPQPSYSAPSPTYERPSSLYGAPRN
ncbi:vitelline membrane protein Vm26Ab-like [Macrobrachium nipponense]|uniref:vitelline membrane protein Vm26Ab-like n=1 Tax=Macrobrachium nipponense TaxID=159736 RepID=UPI0030C7AA32